MRKIPGRCSGQHDNQKYTTSSKTMTDIFLTTKITIQDKYTPDNSENVIIKAPFLNA